MKKASEDEEGLEGFMLTNDEETFWVLEENDAFIARKVSGRNFRFQKGTGKGKSTSKKGSCQRGGFKPFRKSSSGGKANMANEYQDPYDQACWKSANYFELQKPASISQSLLFTCNCTQPSSCSNVSSNGRVIISTPPQVFAEFLRA